MNSQNLTWKFSKYFSEFNLGNVPIDVQELGKLLVLDTVACMASGSKAAPAKQIHQVGTLFGGPGAVAEVGVPELTGAVRAAYVNARIANLLDFDETYPVGVHFGIGAVAAAMSGVQVTQGNFGDLLCSAIAGYEAGARMASAIGPMMQVEDGVVKGFSRVWGVAAPVVIAACVAYGRALKIDDRTMHQAIAIAGSNIPLPIGSKWSDAKHLPDVKYCDAGWCAVTGIHGVESALAGLSGFEDILEGDSAIPQAYSAAMPDSAHLHEGLGERWHLEDITFKPWPTCRFMHQPMTALNKILKIQEIKPEDIEEITVFTGPLANSARFRNPDPKTFASHQFSYAHACAMLALNVPVGADWFDPVVGNCELALSIRDKVKIELYEEGSTFVQHMTLNQIRQMPGAATVKTKAGEWHQSSQFADGDPWNLENKYEKQRVTEKFIAAVPGKSSEDFCTWFWNADENSSVQELTTFLKG